MCVRVLTQSCSVISNFNLTISDSAVPNNIRPGLVGWPCPDEKRHVWARQGGRRGQKWASGCGGVPEKPSEVHGLGRKTAERSDNLLQPVLGTKAWLFCGCGSLHCFNFFSQVFCWLAHLELERHCLPELLQERPTCRSTTPLDRSLTKCLLEWVPAASGTFSVGF